MKIYNAHPVTGEFIGESLADPDVLEGEGHWLIPAHAYTQMPPVTGKHSVAVRDGDSWKVVDDFRGAVYYLNGPQRHVIDTLGLTVPAGATTEPPQPTHAELALEAYAERDRLLFIASLRIAPLQDAEELEEASSADIIRLKAWKQYRVLVNRVPDQAGFPTSFSWPTPPSE